MAARETVAPNILLIITDHHNHAVSGFGGGNTPNPESQAGAQGNIPRAMHADVRKLNTPIPFDHWHQEQPPELGAVVVAPAQERPLQVVVLIE